MTVFSAFDGIAAARHTLHLLGLDKSLTYYASEIDPYAMNISKKNYPDIIQLGDINEIDFESLPKIDFLFGGFPCQSFSFSGEQKGFDDERGMLFYKLLEAKEILERKNPDLIYFFENTAMKKCFENIINTGLGIKPQLINSDIFSAQSRPRNYWCNAGGNPDMYGFSHTNFTVPSRKSISVLGDILEVEFDNKYFLSEKAISGFLAKGENPKYKGIGFCLQPRNVKQKSKCLTSSSEAKNSIQANYINYTPGEVTPQSRIRKLTPTECEALQGFPRDYTAGVSNTQRYRSIGNSWQIETIIYLFSQIFKKS